MSLTQYVATGCAVIHTGQVEITGAQARSRAHKLAAVDVNDAGDGIYQVVNADRYGGVMFKKGESFGYDGIVPKVMADLIVPPEQAATILDTNKPTGKKAIRKRSAASR